MKNRSFVKLLGKAALCVVVGMLLAAPTMGAGPFIEYQEVPHYVSGEGWCLKRVWYYDTPEGQEVFNSQIIC